MIHSYGFRHVGVLQILTVQYLLYIIIILTYIL